MKSKAYIHFFFALFLSFNLNAQYKEFDTFLGDTINVVDKNGLKQGRWVFCGKDSKGLKNKLLKSNQIVTDGHYADGIKQGSWKSYHQYTNNIKNGVNYVQGEIDGKVKFYNDKGKVTHEGTMKKNEWVGDFYIYNTTGKKVKKPYTENKNNCYLNFIGVVTNYGKPMEHVEISVERNELPRKEGRSNTDGSFSVKLDLHNVYVK